MAALEPLVPLLGLALVAALIYGLSRVTGWGVLAERYPALEAMPHPRKWLGYGVFRGWMGYNGGLVVAGDEKGLHLGAMPVVLSWCHPRIFIPWGEIDRVAETNHWYGRLFEIHLRRAPEVQFGLRPGTFEFVRARARRAGVAGA